MTARRTRWLQVRLTQAEHRALKRRAKELKTTVSGLVIRSIPLTEEQRKALTIPAGSLKNVR